MELLLEKSIDGSFGGVKSDTDPVTKQNRSLGVVLF